MITIFLLASIVPPIYLLSVIYKMDKIEPEPPGMILKMFIWGGLATIPAGLIEQFLSNTLMPATGYMSGSTEYNLIMFFVVVAVTEEGVKHFALRKGIWDSPEFNYRFDGVIYSVAVTLGFAAIENIEYVFNFGLNVAALRAVTSIPGHCIFGIYMGYYFGSARYFAFRNKKIRTGFYQFMSMLIPVLMHGFYDFCASSKSTGMTLLFLMYIVILDVIAIRQVRKFAANDDIM